MSKKSFAIPPQSTRVFAGYKLPDVSTEKFYAELGQTFMPGTPYMQAELGLTAYIPAVLDVNMLFSLSASKQVPDEVALIGYSSLKEYQLARTKSLRRRMYTHSHLAVFNMKAAGGGGQFPGPIEEPTRRENRLSWFLFDENTDWQKGHTTLFVGVTDFDLSGDPKGLVEHSKKMKADLKNAGANQVIFLATPVYAICWVHSNESIDLKGDELFGDNYHFKLDQMKARNIEMPTLIEDPFSGQTIEGVDITEPSMFNFKFERDARFSN